jgi:hypothetical protein
LKKNSCAFIAALDSLQGSKFLEELAFPIEKWIDLVNMLRNKILKNCHIDHSEVVKDISQIIRDELDL